MKRLRIIIGASAGLLLLVASPDTTFSAASNDPSWPCIQRKVPELSVGQVWNGPDIPEAAKNWNADPTIDDLVGELAARRNPVDVAQKQIVEFAAGLPKDQVNDKLYMLFQGLFDTLNREREQVISGISRYAGKQRDLAADLRKEASEIDAMRAKPDTNPEELDRRDERLKWETRIFEERVQSLTYVCEVPTIIEQRLYGLSKTIGQSMIKQ
ncbi:hypothetical protein [Phyllobacterium zundukense]|uniref:Secreted protein n=1 Tax=Phyllobacterium zundukense TaxID=1867719 RepID=A0A2N9VPK0_9HYPH|nr:hypothetical protein [Phyllobacterium zundukense]ATU94792.1 hypothetical protein BLM14_23870 [Phyllobacterium zundukense]PIO41418.1 hypothetical protein B5P45_28965 [Phyllobacterium zundukense]